MVCVSVFAMTFESLRVCACKCLLQMHLSICKNKELCWMYIVCVYSVDLGHWSEIGSNTRPKFFTSCCNSYLLRFLKVIGPSINILANQFFLDNQSPRDIL